MFQSPYQTTPTARYTLTDTANAIRKLEIGEELLSVEDHPHIKLVPPGITGFPPFRQAITRLEASTLKADVVLDGRSLVRPDGRPVKDDIYAHAILDAELTARWVDNVDGFSKDLLNLGKFAPKIFAQWISNGLSNRLSLDFGQAAVLRTLAVAYYIQLHTPLPEHPTPEDISRIVLRAARSLPGMDPLTLTKIYGEMPRLNNLQDFVNWVKVCIDSPRTDQLNVGFIYTALNYTFSPQMRETASIALEYPPAFVAMVYSSIIERGFTKFSFGKMIQEGRHQNADKEFVQALSHLLKRR